MNAASEQLCQELYELSGWRDTHAAWQWSLPDGEPYLAYPELERRYGLWTTQDAKGYCPAYDLGYLLRKLEAVRGISLNLTFIGPDWKLGTRIEGTVFSVEFAANPTDAACKLAIELFKQGILQSSDKEADS